MNKSNMNAPANEQGGKKDAIVDQAKHAVENVASNVAGQARDQVNTQFDARKDKAVETMGNVASAIRDTSDKLKGVGPLGDVAGRAADGIESVASFFENKQIGDVIRDVERFARREPAMFLGAAFAIGLIGGRFLKSSRPKVAGGTYARQGGADYDYEASYNASYGDYDYLPEDDLEDDIDSRRFGGYGSQRAGRSTLPMGSRTGQARAGSAGSPGSTGSSYGATQGSYGSTGGSYSASQASSSSSTTQASQPSAPKTPSAPPIAGTPSINVGASSTPNGVSGTGNKPSGGV